MGTGDAGTRPRAVIAGGTGFIGRPLARELAGQGFDVCLLTRDPVRAAAPGMRAAGWDGRTVGAWAEEVSGARAVVNLAGEPIDGLWTAAKRRLLRESRLRATECLAEACRRAPLPPALFLQGSAVGFYGDAQGAEQDECGPPGAGFLSRLAADWEAASEPAAARGTRRAIARTGIVLGRGGGMLGRLLPLFRLNLGGTPGDGGHYLPWIHMSDMTGALRFLIANEALSGPFNLSAPTPAQARDFTAELARALGRRAFLRAPAFALRLLLGDQADELLLADRRAVPHRLLAAGFRFRFPELPAALQDLAAPDNNA